MIWLLTSPLLGALQTISNQKDCFLENLQLNFNFFSVSTVANLYPHKDLSKIRQLLDSMQCSGPDFELDLQMGTLLNENAMKSAGVQEQYFNHLGFRSSLAENPSYNDHTNFVLDSYRSIAHHNDVNCKQDDPFSWLEQ